MQSSSINNYSFPYFSSQERYFSQKVCKEYVLDENDIKLALEAPGLIFSAPEKQLESPFLDVPEEIQKHIFELLDTKDMLRLLAVCKRIHNMTQVIIPRALTTISFDFEMLKARIDHNLQNIKLPAADLLEGGFYTLISFNSYTAPRDIENLLNTNSKLIIPFKTFCLYLIKKTTNEDRQKVMEILKEIIKLQKVSQSHLEKLQQASGQT